MLLPFNNIITANTGLLSTVNIQLGNTPGPKAQPSGGTTFSPSASAEVDAGLFHLSSDGSYTITMYIQLRPVAVPSHVLTLEGRVSVELTWNPGNDLTVSSPGLYELLH